MNTRMRTAVKAMKASPKHDKGMEVEEKKNEGNKLKESARCFSTARRKIALQQDVDKLRRKLKHEEDVHKALKRAFTRPLGALPRLPPYLPIYTLELLAEVAVLEEEVVRLEEQVVNFRQSLYQEAIYFSSSTKRSRENGLTSVYDQFFNQEQHKDHIGKENKLNVNSTKNGKLYSLVKKQVAEKERAASTFLISSDKKLMSKDASQSNGLSEEILRCLLSILSSSSDGFKVEGFGDPYGICLEFERRDIGPYSHLYELEASSIDPNLNGNSLFLFQRLKFLLKKLASVDASELTHQQKLAFWINVYNSCMINAFLENGIPATPQAVAEQMPKAMVIVGGHLLSAMAIKHFILRLTCHSKHTSLEGLRPDEKTAQALFRLDWPEPLVTFALSCGNWSSPAVRVYSAEQVHRQLEEAKGDYLRAAVGISKPNRLAIPKLLDWCLLDFAEDMESLVDWICLQLPAELRNDAVECLWVSSFWKYKGMSHFCENLQRDHLVVSFFSNCLCKTVYAENLVLR